MVLVRHAFILCTRLRLLFQPRFIKDACKNTTGRFWLNILRCIAIVGADDRAVGELRRDGIAHIPITGIKHIESLQGAYIPCLTTIATEHSTHTEWLAAVTKDEQYVPARQFSQVRWMSPQRQLYRLAPRLAIVCRNSLIEVMT